MDEIRISHVEKSYTTLSTDLVIGGAKRPSRTRKVLENVNVTFPAGKLSVLFGKIAKWFADLGSLAFKSTVAKSDLASDVQTSLGKADNALQSYTESDPTVPAWAKAKTKPSYSKSEVGLGNVDNVKQYSKDNPPPYPVTSVNGKTGAVR